MEAKDKDFPVVTEARLASIFTGFSDSSTEFTFRNGECWRQDEDYYYHYGFKKSPQARVISYGDGFFIIVDAIPDEINETLPRPVRVKKIA